MTSCLAIGATTCFASYSPESYSKKDADLIQVNFNDVLSFSDVTAACYR